MRAKLRAVKAEMRQRAHQPILEQGRWLASVLRGHYYYAVPRNGQAVNGFPGRVARHRHKALRRRSQRTRLNFGRSRNPRTGHEGTFQCRTSKGRNSV
jgi:RNA-directed DNA polymerase